MGRGSLEFLYPENRRVLAFVRRYEEERVLVVANLSRFTQCVELDLSQYQGMRPVELFGSTEFPARHGQALFPLAGPARVLLVRTGAEGARSRAADPHGRAADTRWWSRGKTFFPPPCGRR